MLRNLLYTSFITVDYYTVLAVLSSSSFSFITTARLPYLIYYFKQNQRLRIYLFIRNIDRNVQ